VASVTKRHRTRTVIGADGKKKRQRAPGPPLWYAWIKQADESWKRVPTGQPSKESALKWALEEEGRIKRGDARAKIARMFGELADEWEKTLTNRSAKDDRSRLRKHLLPTFAKMRVDQVHLADVMTWIDKMRSMSIPAEKRRGRRLASSDGKLSDATVRHSLNLLSRFFSWAVERGHAPLNPVRQIPTGKRPHQTAKSIDAPWIDDDKVVRNLMSALAPPFRELFYLGNRCGLRPGEVRGLRLGDLAFVGEGVLIVSHSDDGCLKEDKYQKGLSKRVPSPVDFDTVMGDWLAGREADGAQAGDYVFPATSRGALKQAMEEAWREGTDALGLTFGLYEATRHSFVSRNLARGVSLDEVSGAIGHSSPEVTKRYYDRFVRKTYSPALRAGLTAPAAPPAAPEKRAGERGKVVRFRRA
jgi:integrase